MADSPPWTDFLDNQSFQSSAVFTLRRRYNHGNLSDSISPITCPVIATGITAYFAVEKVNNRSTLTEIIQANRSFVAGSIFETYWQKVSKQALELKRRSPDQDSYHILELQAICEHFEIEKEAVNSSSLYFEETLDENDHLLKNRQKKFVMEFLGWMKLLLDLQIIRNAGSLSLPSLQKCLPPIYARRILLPGLSGFSLVPFIEPLDQFLKAIHEFFQYQLSIGHRPPLLEKMISSASPVEFTYKLNIDPLLLDLPGLKAKIRTGFAETDLDKNTVQGYLKSLYDKAVTNSKLYKDELEQARFTEHFTIQVYFDHVKSKPSIISGDDFFTSHTATNVDLFELSSELASFLKDEILVQYTSRGKLSAPKKQDLATDKPSRLISKTFPEYLNHPRKEQLAVELRNMFGFFKSARIYAMMFCLLTQNKLLFMRSHKRRPIYIAWYQYVGDKIPNGDRFSCINNYIDDRKVSGYTYKDQDELDFINLSQEFDDLMKSLLPK